MQKDSKFTENLINQERAQMFTQANATRVFGDDVLHTHPDELIAYFTCNEDTGDEIAGVGKLCCPSECSSMTPLERMLVVSPTNDPFALSSKDAMQKAGIPEASMDFSERRTAAARASAATSASSSESGFSDKAVKGTKDGSI